MPAVQDERAGHGPAYPWYALVVLVGRLSVFTGDLKAALLLALPVQAVAAALLFLAARRLPRA